MSNKLVNDNTPYLNRYILDLPLYRELFVNKETSKRADIYHTRKNTEQTNKSLAEILSQGKTKDKKLVKDGYGKLVSDAIMSNQQSYDQIGGGLNNISGGIQDLGYGIENLSSNIESFAYELQDSIESIYGSNLPEGKSLVDIGRNLSFNGKRAVVALYIHGGISGYKMGDLFHPQFIEQLNNGTTTHDARLFQRKLIGELSNLKTLKQNIDNKKSEQMKLLTTNDPGLDKDSIDNNLSELENKKITVDQNILKLKSMLMSGNEIDLLDVGLVARNSDINSLIQKNIINTDVLEVLVRNKHISGNLSSQFSHIIEINENGIVKPLIELDGITGIFQQEKSQTLLQNIIVQQGKVSNTHLGNIDNNLKTGFVITNQSLNNIGSFVQETNKELGIVNQNLDVVNWNLENLNFGVTKTNKELGIVNQNLNIANWNLENINSSVIETNIYLYDILSVNNISNELLFEGNQLQQVTNDYLDAINETILYTSEGLANILGGIGNIMIDGFEQTVEGLNQINITQQKQLITSQYILNEISKQTIILENIDMQLDNINRSLNKPMEIQSNESFRQGIDGLKISELQLSLDCFQKGLKLSPTHLGNNFGAGIIYKSFGKIKKSIKHLTIALNKALLENSPMLKKIYYELAKAEIKQLNLEKGKELLDSASGLGNIVLEIDFTQAEILLKLGKEIELDLLLYKIVEKIFSGNIDIAGCKKYTAVIKYLQPKLNSYLKKIFKNGNLNKLVNSINVLESLGYNEITEKIAKYILENNPDILYTGNVKIDNIIINNPEPFNKVLREFCSKSRIGGISDTFFYIANQAYRLIDQEIINLIISQGLEFDLDYITMNNTNNLQGKSDSKIRLIKRIYSFGDNAKYMLRDYLKTNNIFNF